MENNQKLDESIPATSMKIIDIYNKIDNDLLDTHPDYQRKLVWKKQHKYAFIDTILNNYPFPEVYIASTDIDVEKMEATEVVVDGQQRLTTIVDYIKGQGDFKNQKKLTPFQNLTPDLKKDFLNYKVSVRDLKDIGEQLIKEIFQRINSTEYSLNTVEKNNAQYGDGEIALFCKQLIDLTFEITEDKTDIIVPNDERKKIYDFFENHKIFSENDRKRMYDFQYIMLILSTILEGNYYARSAKVDEYLEKFNNNFPDYKIILRKFLTVIDILLELNFSLNSYWYNKANVFTLFVELSKIDPKDIEIRILETELLKMEEKFDLYFLAEDESDIQLISEDERKYFEVARHGSHEKPARLHRGKVISDILSRCTSTLAEPLPKEKKNISFLKNKDIDFEILSLTETGLKKNVLDAVSNFRSFLERNNIHNYTVQGLGPDNKNKIVGKFINSKNKIDTNITLYRSNGRGDYRIWFSGLESFASKNNKIAIIKDKDDIFILNISKIDYSTKNYF